MVAIRASWSGTATLGPAPVLRPRGPPWTFGAPRGENRRVLLGRERELEAIERVLREARGGSSGVLAFVGEAGIGKSSLLDTAAEQAEGLLVLRARGVQSEA